MVELRKRAAPPPAPPPAKKRSTSKAKAAKPEALPPVPAAAPAPVNGADSKPPTKSGPPKVGDAITLDGFGGEIETNEGKKVTLASLVEESKAGVVLFTYPKASTPGCQCFYIHIYQKSLLTRDRHESSLPLPRLIRAIDRDRSEHLRSQQ